MPRHGTPTPTRPFIDTVAALIWFPPAAHVALAWKSMGHESCSAHGAGLDLHLVLLVAATLCELMALRHELAHSPPRPGRSGLAAFWLLAFVIAAVCRLAHLTLSWSLTAELPCMLSDGFWALLSSPIVQTSVLAAATLLTGWDGVKLIWNLRARATSSPDVALEAPAAE